MIVRPEHLSEERMRLGCRHGESCWKLHSKIPKIPNRYLTNKGDEVPPHVSEELGNQLYLVLELVASATSTSRNVPVEGEEQSGTTTHCHPSEGRRWAAALGGHTRCLSPLQKELTSILCY